MNRDFHEYLTEYPIFRDIMLPTDRPGLFCPFRFKAGYSPPVVSALIDIARSIVESSTRAISAADPCAQNRIVRRRIRFRGARCTGGAFNFINYAGGGRGWRRWGGGGQGRCFPSFKFRFLVPSGVELDLINSDAVYVPMTSNYLAVLADAHARPHMRSGSHTNSDDPSENGSSLVQRYRLHIGESRIIVRYVTAFTRSAVISSPSIVFQEPALLMTDALSRRITLRATRGLTRLKRILVQMPRAARIILEYV